MDVCIMVVRRATRTTTQQFLYLVTLFSTALCITKSDVSRKQLTGWALPVRMSLGRRLRTGYSVGCCTTAQKSSTVISFAHRSRCRLKSIWSIPPYVAFDSRHFKHRSYCSGIFAPGPCNAVRMVATVGDDAAGEMCDFPETKCGDPKTACSAKAEDVLTGPQQKVIFIIGGTCVGKSRLGMDLCLHLKNCNIKAEIINADSMQVYRRCDIGTAKASKSDREQIVHHLLDCCDVSQVFTAFDFVREAKRIIADLHERGTVPVVVGGTQLYIQHLLWESAFDAYEELSDQMPDFDETKWESLDNYELHKHLLSLDPVRAWKLHPHDRRRILRSIEVTLRSGFPHSRLMEQRKTGTENGLRYDSCIFWLDTRNREELDERLRTRVMRMLQDGLLTEIEWLVKMLNVEVITDEGPSSVIVEGNEQRNRRDADSTAFKYCKDAMTTGGILQSIGYKEFFPLFLTSRPAVQSAPHVGKTFDRWSRFGIEPTSPISEAVVRGIDMRELLQCADTVVLHSLQLARRQRKWIRNKFLLRQINLPLYFFETTSEHVMNWEGCILGPAKAIVEEFLNDIPFTECHPNAAARSFPGIRQILPSDSSSETLLDNDKSIVDTRKVDQSWKCEACDRTIYGAADHKSHLKSRNHKRKLRHAKKVVDSLEQPWTTDRASFRVFHSNGQLNEDYPVPCSVTRSTTTTDNYLVRR